jgi:PAS domain S-box-containing protein
MGESGVRLTDRERAVLRLVVERYGNAEIAERLSISKRTVESHVAGLIRKYGVPSRRDLIATAGPSTFRAALTDALRTLTDPAEVQARAAGLLGRHLAAGRAYYQEFDWSDGTTTLHRDYTEGEPSIAGTYSLATYTTEPLEEALRTGSTLVVRDVAELEPRAAAAWSALSVRAALAAPHMRGGVCIAALGVTSAHPRNWTLEDIALLEETAERTWAFVERVRLENELDEAEDRFLTIADSMPALVWQTDASSAPVFVNRMFREHTGMTATSADVPLWQQLLRPDGAGSPEDWPGRGVRGRTPWRGRVQVRRHDGTWHDFDATISPRSDAEGTYLGQLGVGHAVDGSAGA